MRHLLALFVAAAIVSVAMVSPAQPKPSPAPPADPKPAPAPQTGTDAGAASRARLRRLRPVHDRLRDRVRDVHAGVPREAGHPPAAGLRGPVSVGRPVRPGLPVRGLRQRAGPPALSRAHGRAQLFCLLDADEGRAHLRDVEVGRGA